ncbi:hypothetical protein PHISCL_07217 [Aspergillus sclerotialis]|uniref:F-box domain-containing protein n=1 Tax=Aspergillus sclerotialis TaxID=2070753 RepID=A0A3A2ZBZ6_9EURO|nr:hypothetical protein PHISCL_07217 [Aspergillus sclerotialis]
MASHLQQLPLELFYTILGFLDFKSIEKLSLASRTIRKGCIPSLFECVSSTFSAESFGSLIELVSSPSIARHVKTLKYNPTANLHPATYCKKQLTTLYAPDLYVDEQGFGHWRDHKGHEMRYSDVMELIKRTAQDQKDIIENPTDSAMLTMALQKLPSLSKFVLHFDWCSFDPSRKLNSVVYHNWGDEDDDICYYQHHLIIYLQALGLSQSSNSRVTDLRVTKNNLDLDLRERQIIILQKAFAKIEALTLDSSDPIFKYLVEERVNMPVLKELVIMSRYERIRVDELVQFCQRNVRHLEFLHVKCRLHGDEVECRRRYLPLPILQKLWDIGHCCVLQEAKLNDGLYENNAKLEALLLRKIAYEDIESAFKR